MSDRTNEYSKELKFNNFDHFFLEREADDEFHLDIQSKDSQLYVSLNLNKAQLFDIINEIENGLSGTGKGIEPKHLDHVELLEDDKKYVLDIGVGTVFTSIHFNNKDDVNRFSSELKIASGWSESSAVAVQSNVEEEAEERRISSTYVIYHEAPKKLVDYMKSKSMEEIANEIADFARDKLPKETMAFRGYDVMLLADQFWLNKGFQEHDLWHLPDELRIKYRQAERLARDIVEGEFLQRQRETLEVLATECVKMAKAKDKQKLKQVDVERFVFDKKLKLNKSMIRMLHSMVNERLAT